MSKKKKKNKKEKKKKKRLFGNQSQYKKISISTIYLPYKKK